MATQERKLLPRPTPPRSNKRLYNRFRAQQEARRELDEYLLQREEDKYDCYGPEESIEDDDESFAQVFVFPPLSRINSTGRLGYWATSSSLRCPSR